MFGIGLLTFMGWGARQPSYGRKAGQLTIGIALGLYFTPAALAELSNYAGWMAATAVISILSTVLCARYFQKLSRVDGMTAAYACAIGAASDMAIQAQKRGADGASVATSHAVRVMVVVTVIPFLTLALGEGSTESRDTTTRLVSEILLGPFVLLVLSSIGLVFVLRKTAFPNPWILIPIITAGAYAAMGHETRLPQPVVNAGSLLIGWHLGQYMTREFFTSAPRILFAAFSMTLVMLGITIGFAYVLHEFAGLDLLSALVATAPGGVAEMALTAKVLGLGAPLVTAFHLFRLVTVLLIIKGLADLLIRFNWIEPHGSLPMSPPAKNPPPQ